MPVLTIADFSCLKDARFQLAPINIIIGPQGSGKSVTTKMFYFFADIPITFFQCVERGLDFDDFKRHVAKQFSIWFPPSAWGSGRSNINYVAGQFTVRILRRKIKHVLVDEVVVSFSDWFCKIYNEALSSIQKSKPPILNLDSNNTVDDIVDHSWRVRQSIDIKFRKEIENDYIYRQTFIPAGRAFFTSIGRLVAGLEQVGSLDPVTIKFARLFASLRDRKHMFHYPHSSRSNPESLSKSRLFMEELFGGDVRIEPDGEFVQTRDGRKIPFSSLSSGQQELMPMWSMMNYFTEMDAFRSNSRGSKQNKLSSRELVYIEEPEAHLFPSAQSRLMEFLVSSISHNKSHRSLIITTHSPYILSKLNVFLKAGQLSRKKKKNQEIADIVAKDLWIGDSQISAYSIGDGKLSNLVDDDGLIDGRYLDSISEELSEQYSRLLKIEMEMTS